MKREKKKAVFSRLETVERAIKEKCIDSMCGQKKVDCETPDCSLYPFSPWGSKKQFKSHSKKDYKEI